MPALRGNLIRSASVTAKNAAAMGRLKKGLLERGEKSLSKRIDSLIPLITEEVRKTISVPYVPGTRTPKGAPIRKRTGRAWRGVFVKKIGPLELAIGNTAKSQGKGGWLRKLFRKATGAGFPYAAYHEVKKPGQPGSGLHPYVRRTLLRIKGQIRRILGGGSRRLVTHR